VNKLQAKGPMGSTPVGVLGVIGDLGDTLGELVNDGILRCLFKDGFAVVKRRVH
jgi:hypothetical protein